MSTTPIRKILIANRSEIAIRIAKAAHSLNIPTVAVYSSEDRKAWHPQFCHEAYEIGPAPSAESYLRVEKLLEVAQISGANAIHPGYGFLSENAAFARAVEEAGLIFIGPSAAHIDEMGDKVRAREKMSSLGLPIVPGTAGHTDLDRLEKEVKDLLKKQKDFRFPLLVKASGGGGGKGMRRVDQEKDLRPALERAQSESLKAFGNAEIFVERFIENPRHIEVQILGDGHEALHLFERECSLQRRHQKVIEEAPSPSLGETARRQMLKIASEAAREMKYKSAGTMEFIVSPEDEFYFLEMNTRIQVEHPVTEEITGIDLVQEQIRIAGGERLRFSQEDITCRGHAIEARLYAEDAENDFRPAPGIIEELQFYQGPGIRIDSGIESRGKVSSFYDPMIAKVIGYAASREAAIKALEKALGRMRLEGCISNRAFLLDILRQDFFQKAQMHTQLLESEAWRSPAPLTSEVVAQMCLLDFQRQGGFLNTNSEPLSSWQSQGGMGS